MKEAIILILIIFVCMFGCQRMNEKSNPDTTKIVYIDSCEYQLTITKDVCYEGDLTNIDVDIVHNRYCHNPKHYKK